jgi:hypothetical protein
MKNDCRLVLLRSRLAAARNTRSGLVQARAGDLAAKNRKLVSKHHDLEFLELTRTQT